MPREVTNRNIAATVAAAAACLLVGALCAAPGADAQTPTKKTKKLGKTKSLTRKQSTAFLRQGYDSLQAKRYKQAVAELTTAMSSGKLRRTEMAKALYYRGIANRGAKRPADAISDLTSALWLKGALSKKERSNALSQRQQSYAEAGVSGNALLAPLTTAATPPTVAPSQPTKTQPKKVRTAAKPTAKWETSTDKSKSTGTASNAASPTAGITSFFNNLFTTGSTQPTTTATAPPSKPGAPAAASTSSWSSATRIASKSVAKPKRPAANPRPRRPVAPAAQPATGRYHLEIAPSQGRNAANAVARRLSTQYASLLGGRRPVVSEKIVPGIGKLHYVKVKPYRSQSEAGPVCQKLLASGMDCFIGASK